MSRPDKDPAVPVPPMLGQQGTQLGPNDPPGRLCNFCHKTYQGHLTTCPHCGKKFPKMPSGHAMPAMMDVILLAAAIASVMSFVWYQVHFHPPL